MDSNHTKRGIVSRWIALTAILATAYVVPFFLVITLEAKGSLPDIARPACVTIYGPLEDFIAENCSPLDDVIDKYMRFIKGR